MSRYQNKAVVMDYSLAQIAFEFGAVPEGATHLDHTYPEYLKLDECGQWWYWKEVGGTCVGYEGKWNKESESNCNGRTTMFYIELPKE